MAWPLLHSPPVVSIPGVLGPLLPQIDDQSLQASPRLGSPPPLPDSFWPFRDEQAQVGQPGTGCQKIVDHTIGIGRLKNKQVVGSWINKKM